MKKLSQEVAMRLELCGCLVAFAAMAYVIHAERSKRQAARNDPAPQPCAQCREISGPGEAALNDPTPITLVKEKREGRWSYFLFDADGNPKTIEYIGRHHWCAGNPNPEMLIGAHHAASNLAWTIRLGKVNPNRAREISGE